MKHFCAYCVCESHSKNKKAEEEKWRYVRMYVLCTYIKYISMLIIILPLSSVAVPLPYVSKYCSNHTISHWPCYETKINNESDGFNSIRVDIFFFLHSFYNNLFQFRFRSPCKLHSLCLGVRGWICINPLHSFSILYIFYASIDRYRYRYTFRYSDYMRILVALCLDLLIPVRGDSTI